MQRIQLRVGAVLGAAATLVGLAIANANCASPTEISVDIRAESSLCTKVKSTGVAVSSPERLENEQLKVFDGPGCETPPGDRFGTLTITPSGEKDDEIAFRVVAGVDRPA